MPRARRLALVRLVTGAAVLAAIVYAPIDLLHVWRDVRNAHAQPRAARVDLPAASVGVEEPAAVARAAAVIPAAATYGVVTGPAARVRGPQSLDYVKFWAAFTLLPRRQTARPEDAQWLLGYGADLRSLSLRVGRVVDLGGGVTVARVKR